MSVAWRIDSLDARAGLAFASWRTADLLSADPKLEIPAVFLSPPAFRPEALASRAVGFSASRATSQYGLFLGEAELGFETLEALIEFVRRAYLSGGGGDTSGGGGGPPTPPDLGPEIGPGEFREEEGEGRGAAWAVVAAGKHARGLAENLQPAAEGPTPVARFDLTEAGVEISKIPRSDTTLERGAVELLLELMRRYPMKESNDRKLVWSRAACRLGSAISRLGLWHWLMEEPAGSTLDGAARQIAPAIATRLPYDRFLVPILFEGLSSGWPGIHPAHFGEWLYYARHFGIAGGRPGASRFSGDPLDDLSAWPLPIDVARLVKAGQEQVSAFNLMSALNATPAKLADAESSDTARRGAAIYLFSAAHVIAEVTPTPVIADLHAEALGSTARASLEWIARQWPSLIFPRPVEEAIELVSKASSASVSRSASI